MVKPQKIYRTRHDENGLHPARYIQIISTPLQLSHASGGAEQRRQMPARRESADADPVGIEIVFGGVGSKPSDCSFAIFDLCWKRCDARKTIINARDRISFVYHPNSRTSLFSAPVPASTVNPNNYGQRRGDFPPRVEIKPEFHTIDSLIN